MRVITARNVNDAYYKGLELLREEGVEQDSRAGPVLVLPEPVTTVYSHPQERVLFCPFRDANPLFHLFESLWMIAGWRDARWLDLFVRDFSERFAEEDGNQHGAYGYRWRHHFDMEGGGEERLPDQIETVVRLLRDNPDDRRVVLGMWDPVADLGVSRNDVPCNTTIYLRSSPTSKFNHSSGRVLDLTVCCRSNDIIWGAYGANSCHFSMLQEYLAARIRIGIGRLYQVSNNFHAYRGMLEKVGAWDTRRQIPDGYLGPGSVQAQSFIKTPAVFDYDLTRWMLWSTSDEPDQEPQEYPDNPWLHETAEPLYCAARFWRQGERDHALEIVEGMGDVFPIAPDWCRAVSEWMRRRMK